MSMFYIVQSCLRLKLCLLNMLSLSLPSAIVSSQTLPRSSLGELPKGERCTSVCIGLFYTLYSFSFSQRALQSHASSFQLDPFPSTVSSVIHHFLFMIIMRITNGSNVFWWCKWCKVGFLMIF